MKKEGMLDAMERGKLQKRIGDENGMKCHNKKISFTAVF